MCLQDVIREFLFHGMEIKEVIDERWEYALTLKHWAERFEMNRDKLVAICGEESWRAFHLYLWGTHKALTDNNIQAYHIIAEKSEAEGVRPSIIAEKSEAEGVRPSQFEKIIALYKRKS